MGRNSALLIGRVDGGYAIRVEGHGTVRESPAVHEFVLRAFGEERCAVVIDLAECDHLDSTFLGCLVDLHKRAAHCPPAHIALAAGPERRKRLLAPTQLDSYFDVVADAPAICGEWIAIPSRDLDRSDLGAHILECHRRLAELGGRNQAVFGPVAEQLARELAGQR